MGLNEVTSLIDAGFDTTWIETPSSRQNKVFDSWSRFADEAGLSARTPATEAIEDLDSLGHFDLLIWQSYRVEEYERWLPLARRHASVTSKSFPQIAPGSDKDQQRLLSASQTFDVVALALQSDFLRAREITPVEISRRRIGYVPRGFNAELISRCSEKSARPLLVVDKAISDDTKASDHRVNQILTECIALNPDLDVISFGGSRPGITVGSSLPYLPFWDFYARVIGPAWVYLCADYDLGIHATQNVPIAHGGTASINIYENQVVEAQIAGCRVVGPEGYIPHELGLPESADLNASYTDPRSVAEKVTEFIQMGPRAGDEDLQRFAAHHSSRNMIESWLSLVEERLSAPSDSSNPGD
jgi:hypothetical protein